jgi:hypothetical protein
MFKINPNAVHNWDVEIPWPAADGKGHKMQKFTARFKRINADDYLSHTRKIVDAATSEDQEGIDEIRELLREVFVGFKGIEVEDDDGKPVEVENSVIIDYLLEDVAGARSLYQAYNEMIAGQPEKN